MRRPLLLGNQFLRQAAHLRGSVEGLPPSSFPQATGIPGRASYSLFSPGDIHEFPWETTPQSEFSPAPAYLCLWINNTMKYSNYSSNYIEHICLCILYRAPKCARLDSWSLCTRLCSILMETHHRMLQQGTTN